MFRRIGLAAAVAICLGLLGGVARAQTSVPLVAGSQLTLGSLAFTVSSCTISNGLANESTHLDGDGNPTSSCLESDNLILAQDPNFQGTGVGVVIQSMTAGAPIFSAHGCGSNCPTGDDALDYDISLQLDVSALDSHTKIIALSQSITGSAVANTEGNQQAVHVGEDVYSGDYSAYYGSPTSDLSSPSHSVTIGTTCPGTGTCLSIFKDLGLLINSADDGSTLGLTSVAQGFTTAPEPASIAVLTIGLLGLGGLRRRRRA